MSKTISSLNVVLGATVAPLVSGFKRAEEAGQSLTGALFQIAAPIAGLEVIAHGFQEALSGFGLLPLINEQSEAIDSTAKLSDRLGISTEQLTGFQHAGNLAGASSELLTGSIEKMLKNVTDAAQGTGVAGDALNALHLNAKALANSNPGDAFTQIAEGLKNMKSPFERAQIAQDIFGKSGQELLPTLMGGAEGLKQAADEAKALGLSYSRVDAAKVEAANDAMTRVGEAFSGVERQLVVALAPAIQTAADLFTGWGESVVSIVQTYLPGVVNIASSVFGEVSSIVTGAWNGIYGFVAPIVSGIVGWIGANWQSMLETASTIWTSVWGVVSSVGGAIWDIITTVGGAIVDTWDWAMSFFGTRTQTATTTAAGWMTTFSTVLHGITDGISLAFNTLAFGISHFGEIFEYTLIASAAGIVTFGNQVGYIFTGVIGGYLGWLAQNWQNIFTDMLNFTATVFTNMATNAGSFFTGLWSWMKGDGFNFKWTGLTEGFKSTLSDLPTIADRQIGGLEKSLHDQADTMGNAIGIGYSDFLKQQADGSKETADKIKAGVGDAADWIKNAFSKSPTVPTPKMDHPKPFDINTDPAKKKLSDVKQQADDLKPVFANSAEAFLRSFDDQSLDGIGAAATAASPTATANAAPVAATLPSSAVDTASTSSSQNDTMAVVAQGIQSILQFLLTGNGNTAGVPIRIVTDDTSPALADV